MAVMTSLVFLGQFLSPLILGSLSDAFGGGSTRFTFAMLAAASAAPFPVLLAQWIVGLRGAAPSREET